ncbi:VOC family protein [Actinophytocola sp.]|uniref:VOC family protein n=1 Tax=Actinophytocola sp. TaxID=1872138 RepID=UPI002D7FE1E8|nr:VOC family protein [Actinophytocola sp.]HET9143902.1 VOC family protein [Actinophytocola sp.]
MFAAAELIAFVPTTDLDRAREFYARTLGLPLRSANSFACVFIANGTMLRVTAVQHLTPQPFTVLGWGVPDIEAKARELVAAGLELERFDILEQDELGIWTAPDGDRVAWFQDPDGNRLSIAQFD